MHDEVYALHLAQWKVKDKADERWIIWWEVSTLILDSGQGCGRNVDRVAFSDR